VWSIREHAGMTTKVDKHTSTRLAPTRLSHEVPFLILGMVVALTGCIVLCAINPLLLNNLALQSLTASTFAIAAAILYLLYMIISKMVAIVFRYIEMQHYSAFRRRATDYVEEEGDDDDEPLGDDELLYLLSEEDIAPTRLPREAVIASMYLGGSGTFLAIPALCMWDISVSSAFALALLVVAFLDAGKVATEFRTNVDTVFAITNLRRLRFLHQCAVLGMLLYIVWLDSQDRAHLLVSPLFGAQWPLVLLSASSPFLLRGGGSRALRGMSPAQTLETALPVCTLLAFLVLCWYGPLEKILLAHFTSPLQTLLPMLILCPPCLAATLAFVLYSLKRRQTLVTVTLFTCGLFIRQQVLQGHRMQTRFDWFALSSAFNMVVSSISYYAYHRRVVWVAPPAPLVDLQA
jgi:hypothetical protein